MNLRPRDPKSRTLPAAPHPDMLANTSLHAHRSPLYCSVIRPLLRFRIHSSRMCNHHASFYFSRSLSRVDDPMKDHIHSCLVPLCGLRHSELHMALCFAFRFSFRFAFSLNNLRALQSLLFAFIRCDCHIPIRCSWYISFQPTVCCKYETRFSGWWNL